MCDELGFLFYIDYFLSMFNKMLPLLVIVLFVLFNKRRDKTYKDFLTKRGNKNEKN